MILQAAGLSMDFGGLRAVDRVDIQVNEGEIVALIGPNGAGKTTFFNCVSGVYRPTEGSIRIQPPGGVEVDITGLKPNRVAERGLARTFQNIRLFPTMTALENVMIGRDCRLKSGLLGALLRDRSVLPTTPTSWRGTFRTAPNAGWRSRGPSPPNRFCSSSTNLPPG